MSGKPSLSKSAILIAALPATMSMATTAAPQGIAPLQAEFANGATVRVYGQVNKGVLSYDDGVESEDYVLIDNDNSSTRFGLRYEGRLGAWAFENVNEFKYAPYSTGGANVIDKSRSSSDRDWSNDNIRKIDFAVEHASYGKVWIGQGSMATDGVAEYDLSGTDVIGYSGVSDSAGGQIIRFSDPDLSFADNPKIGDAFQNYDGGRLARVRYDTPSFNGFSLAVAYGQDLLQRGDVRDIRQYDISLNYAATLHTVRLSGGVGYYGNDDDGGISVWAGSASAIHAPTGLNGTFAAGTQQGGGGDGAYWYGKLGLLRTFVPWGDTAMAADYYRGDDVFLTGDVRLFNSGGEPVFDENGNAAVGDITSSKSRSWGLSLVQNVDVWNTEVWLTVRDYAYSDDLASYEDGRAIFGGARFQF